MLLHICTDYIWNELYYELISRLQANIDNIVYVPINVNKNFKDKDRHEQYTVIKSYLFLPEVNGNFSLPASSASSNFVNIEWLFLSSPNM